MKNIEINFDIEDILTFIPIIVFIIVFLVVIILKINKRIKDHNYDKKLIGTEVVINKDTTQIVNIKRSFDIKEIYLKNGKTLDYEAYVKGLYNN